MIRRSTVVYVILLLVLAGAYYYLNNREQASDIEVTVEPGTDVAETYLFTAEEGTPSSIRIESKTGDTVEVARGADSAWQVIEPVEAAADQGAAEAAATQITTMLVVDTVPDVDPSIVGLEDPEYVLILSFTNGGERSVDVGNLTPSESGYYVRDGDAIVIVSRNAIASLLALLENPPYLETPTPDPETPEAGTVPGETVTPAP